MAPLASPVSHGLWALAGVLLIMFCPRCNEHLHHLNDNQYYLALLLNNDSHEEPLSCLLYARYCKLRAAPFTRFFLHAYRSGSMFCLIGRRLGRGHRELVRSSWSLGLVGDAAKVAGKKKRPEPVGASDVRHCS